MATYLIKDETLTNIANAIREKSGKTDSIKPIDMADEIDNLLIFPESILAPKTLNYVFYNGNNDWLLENYGDKMVFNDIISMNSAFTNSRVKNIIVPINCKSMSSYDTSYSFRGCSQLEYIEAINNLEIYNCSNLFNGCSQLRYLPKMENLRRHTLNNSTFGPFSSMFYNCYSLREIPEELLKLLYYHYSTSSTSYYYGCFYDTFDYCYSLDELRGIPAHSKVALTANLFYSIIGLTRLKNFIFETDENGNSYEANWKNQTISLTSVGYGTSSTIKYILQYNSGITADKQVKDDATYQALKNDPDWFSADVNYSRYNHDSAVATINSLPDTSAYLASNGGTNTIKFTGASGALTDGGAINTLTEEEIAVATAKGWTVSLV